MLQLYACDRCAPQDQSSVSRLSLTVKPVRISRNVGPFTLDRWLIGLLLIAAIAVAGRGWLAENPQHNPWAPLDLNDPPGLATEGKLLALRDNPQTCRDVLTRSEIAFTTLAPTGKNACRRQDRTVMGALPLSPAPPPTTCTLGAGLHLWLRDVVQPAAAEILASEVTGIEHYGAYSCRRLYGRSEGQWSEHATGNAIDIAAFVLADGSRITVLGDWDTDGSKQSRFLMQVRDGSCDLFSTVLSPDYNRAHRDHFHFDQSPRYRSVCR